MVFFACRDFLSWHSWIQSISSRNCTVFLELSISLPQNTNLFLILETLAACPWSCTCCTSHRQIIDSPSLQSSQMLIGQLGHLHVLEVTPNMIDSSRGQRLVLHLWGSMFASMGHNWGSSLLHSYTTEDPPFCTRYIQNPKIWLVTANKSGTESKNAHSGADPI